MLLRRRLLTSSVSISSQCTLLPLQYFKASMLLNTFPNRRVNTCRSCFTSESSFKHIKAQFRCRRREDQTSRRTHLTSYNQDFARAIKHALYPRLHPVDIRGMETRWRRVLFTTIPMTMSRRDSRIKLFRGRRSMRLSFPSHWRCLEDVKPNSIMKSGGDSGTSTCRATTPMNCTP